MTKTRDIELTDEAYAVLMNRQRDDESISETIERIIDEYEAKENQGDEQSRS